MAVSHRKMLKEKLNPPHLEYKEDLTDEELLRLAMADVNPIQRGAHEHSWIGRRRRPSRGREAPPPEQPLIDFMRNVELVESHHHPDYIEGGSMGWDRRLIRKLRRGGFSVQEDIDLHGFTQAEARRELESFLREAVQRGLTCVRIVHGKGRNSPNHESVLKKKVPEWLSQRRLARFVAVFASAPMRDGGSGATYVLLRNGFRRGRWAGKKQNRKRTDSR